MDDGVSTARTIPAGEPDLSSTYGALNQSDHAGAIGVQAVSGVKDAVQSLRSTATGKVQEVVEDGKAQITSALNEVATAAHEIADKLNENGGGAVSPYIVKVATTVEGWSQDIQRKTPAQIGNDVRDFARRSPGIAIGLAVAAGLIVTRLLKAETASGRPR
ncbi:MAG: hypothetical protein M3N26_03585 [Pseudomonadota bacterium]|nr:hypothetical protein [Pseudomonadota bacterium]